MVNCTENIMEFCNYNLSKIFGLDMINAPEKALANYNVLMNYYVIISVLIIFGLVLFLFARRLEDVADSTAAVYAGLMTSIAATLLFVVNTGLPGVKLILWEQLAAILVFTGIAILVDYVSKRK